jgi:cation transport ATPase
MSPADHESSPTAVQSPPTSSSESIDTLLNRPREQRVREFQYRFAQSVVFGLPVLALQRYGAALGWVEAGRWVGVLQLLLAGWVVYVGAAGMLFEGALLLRRGLTADFVVALIATVLYVLSVGLVAISIVRGNAPYRTWFDVVVVLIALWSGARWFRMSRL